MPGFFESLKRMAQGKPVFDANDNAAGWADKDGNAQEPIVPAGQEQERGQAVHEQRTSVVKGQSSTFPVVVVKRTRTQVNGNNQTVYCSIVNRFAEAVELDEIDVAGGSRRLGGVLRPGEEREYLCYSGPRSSGESHKVATLNYKVDETGDYFQSVYDVEYAYAPDKLYAVEELHFRAPIVDIYG